MPAKGDLFMHYKFYNVPDLENFLLESLGVDFLLLSACPEQVEYFHNGDKMTIHIPTGELFWEPIEPGSFTTSRLAFRFHQWFVKGFIRLVQ